MRLAALLWLLGACITLTTAAPVPKGPPPAKPTKLTAEMLEGSWQYQWSSSLNGWITFDKDGTYTAQHHPGSNTVYSGTYSVEGGSITITEFAYDVMTGNGSGPQVYRFDCDVKEWPALPGKSTGSGGVGEANLHLKLTK